MVLIWWARKAKFYTRGTNNFAGLCVFGCNQRCCTYLVVRCRLLLLLLFIKYHKYEKRFTFQMWIGMPTNFFTYSLRLRSTRAMASIFSFKLGIGLGSEMKEKREKKKFIRFGVVEVAAAVAVVVFVDCRPNVCHIQQFARASDDDKMK